MIYDSLSNFSKYVMLNPLFPEVRALIESDGLSRLPEGRHPIGNRGIYASISNYIPKLSSECFFESHYKYVDIQIVLKGLESIGVGSAEECGELEYDAGRDFRKLGCAENFYFKLRPGFFCIFFKDDAHMTQVRYGDVVCQVTKAVVKVPDIQRL